MAKQGLPVKLDGTTSRTAARAVRRAKHGQQQLATRGNQGPTSAALGASPAAGGEARPQRQNACTASGRSRRPTYDLCNTAGEATQEKGGKPPGAKGQELHLASRWLSTVYGSSQELHLGSGWLSKRYGSSQQPHLGSSWHHFLHMSFCT